MASQGAIPADPSLNYTELGMLDVLSQNITFTTPGGMLLVVPLTAIDANNAYIVAKTIAYSVEFGLSLMMLIVLLAMTPKSKFWRLGSYINIAALCNNLVRTMLTVVFFESSWVRFYTLYSGDITAVTDEDFRNSLCAIIFTIPQNILMLAALMLQAWAMVSLWPRLYKWGILVFSGILSLMEVVFMLAAQADQIRSLFPDFDPYDYLYHRLWVRYTWLGFELADICWFCFIFIIRLVMHMWQNRSFLPSTKGVAAMDMLVMTNGVLMLIPVLLIALQVSERVNFETGSLVYTAVIVVLPLGTLLAQRLSDPAAFNSEYTRGTATETARQNTAASSKRPLLPTFNKGDDTGPVFTGPRGSESGQGKTGVVSTVSSDRYAELRGSDAISPIDMELSQIDGDLESGRQHGRVKVDRQFEQSEEML